MRKQKHHNKQRHTKNYCYLCHAKNRDTNIQLIMRKLVLILITLIVAIAAHAQGEHLKFMGIELKGSITEFQQQLLTKGMRVSYVSKGLPEGERVYDGRFSGYPAQVVVFFNSRTRLVYRAKVMIDLEGRDHATSLLNEMKAKLDIKYGGAKRRSQDFTDEYGHKFEQSAYTLADGEIDLFVTSSGYTDHDTFYVNIDYKDAKNTSINTLDELEDL